MGPLDDYVVLERIGEGSFGKVNMVGVMCLRRPQVVMRCGFTGV